MATHQSISAPARSQSTPQPIVPFGAHLFRPESLALDPMQEECLPFVSDSHSGGLPNYWDVPAEPKDLETVEERLARSKEQAREFDAAMGRAKHFGNRAAAAYMIFLMKNGGDALPLPWILRSMADSPESSYTQQNFWFYLNRMLYLYSFTLSASQVAADVEAYIADGDQYDDEIIGGAAHAA